LQIKASINNTGARPLKRAIQKYIEDALAEEIIKSNVHEGDTITLDVGKDDSKLDVKISTSNEAKKS
jgi:ATP-dependent Clp protease ATP-binding subunit ClpC